jgi:hypothetical protein
MLRSVCLILAALATIGGGLGVIVRGLKFMNQPVMELRTADATALVAVAVIFGAGLISLAVCAARRE